MPTAYEILQKRLGKLNSLGNIGAVLSWDQEVQMPPGGVEARARQLALVAEMRHEMLISDETGDMLENARAEVGDDGDSDAARTIRVFAEDYKEAHSLPAAFVAEFASETALAHEIWAKARQDSDFSHFQPKLEKLVEMAQQMAEYIGYDESPYDALLGQYERGMTTAQVKGIFDAHRPALVDLLKSIGDRPQVDDSPVRQYFDPAKQKRFALEMVAAMGFDFERGVQDVAVHPFCTHFSSNDVRITTRFEDNFLNPALFGMMHEAGHGMYEQGISQSL
ncbi:MAG: carboxypeptidase M32, partial [Aggregatilineales bacterium]